MIKEVADSITLLRQLAYADRNEADTLNARARELLARAAATESMADQLLGSALLQMEVVK